MAYTEDKNIGGLETLTTATLADGDLIVIGDVSDSNRAKGVALSNLFPASSTDNALARFDGTTGKLVQNSGMILDDTGGIVAGTIYQFPAPTTSGNGTAVGIVGGAVAVGSNGIGGLATIGGRKGDGSGAGGAGNLVGGQGGATGTGGAAIIQGGAGGATSGNGGGVTIQSGDPTIGSAGDILITGSNGTQGNGGSITLRPGTFDTSGANGKLYIYGYNGLDYGAILDASTITTSHKTFTFPNATGVLGVVVTKTDTGDPTGIEGLFEINTFDNKFKVYADGAWRQLATW